MWISNTNDSILVMVTRSICHFVFAKKRGGQREIGRVGDAITLLRKANFLSHIC